MADFSEWEGSKENIVPLRQGRDPQELLRLCQDPAHRPQSELDEEKQSYEERLKNLMTSGEDMLDVWESYIEWAQQIDLTGSTVLPLLERCTEQLKGVGMYNEEFRFLKLYLTLASYNDDPMDVFNFLNNNEIGIMYSLLYEEWATALERRGNSAQADKVYELGIRRGAQPLERLKKSHRHFQRRLIESIQNSLNNNEGAKKTTSSLSDGATRAPLGRLVKPSQRGLSMAASSSTKSSSSKAPSSSRQTKLMVYEESSDENAVPTSSASWNRLATRSERTKENNPLPAKWSSTTLPQKKVKKAPTPPAAPSFVIYEDPTPEPEITPQPTPPTSNILPRV